MSEFFAMGGYAAYVWAAFGFAALVLAGLLAQSWQAARRRDAELEQLKRLAGPQRRSRSEVRRPVPAGKPGMVMRADSGGPGTGA